MFSEEEMLARQSESEKPGGEVDYSSGQFSGYTAGYGQGYGDCLNGEAPQLEAAESDYPDDSDDLEGEDDAEDGEEQDEVDDDDEDETSLVRRDTNWTRPVDGEEVEQGGDQDEDESDEFEGQVLGEEEAREDDWRRLHHPEWYDSRGKFVGPDSEDAIEDDFRRLDRPDWYDRQGKFVGPDDAVERGDARGFNGLWGKAKAYWRGHASVVDDVSEWAFGGTSRRATNNAEIRRSLGLDDDDDLLAGGSYQDEDDDDDIPF